MTLWEFHCCMEGYRKAHQTEEAAPPPMDEKTAGELGIEGF